MNRIEDLTDNELMQFIYETYETMDGKLRKKLQAELNRRWRDE